MITTTPLPHPLDMSADNEGPSMELCAAFKNNLHDLYHLEIDEIADGIFVGSISSEYEEVVGSGVVDYEELYPDIIHPITQLIVYAVT